MAGQPRHRRSASALELVQLGLAAEGSPQAAPLCSRTEPENIERPRGRAEPILASERSPRNTLNSAKEKTKGHAPFSIFSRLFACLAGSESVSRSGSENR